MVHPSPDQSRSNERLTGPRRDRYKSLSEARQDAELPAGEFEMVHPASRPARHPIEPGSGRRDR